MAKRRRSKKTSTGKKRGKRKSAKNHVPLPILEKRLRKLGGIVSERGSDYYVAKD